MRQEQFLSLLNPKKVCGNFNGRLGDLRLDSRQVQPGDVFIAVRGSQQDGHHFITSAIGNRAGAILAEQLPEVPTNVLGIEIANTGKLLGRLAQSYYGNPADRLILAGVTGTNGKTTITSLLYHVYQVLRQSPGIIGTNAIRFGNRAYPSRLTTPDAIELARAMRDMVSYGIRTVFMEASSHALDQSRLDGLSFQIGVFSNLSHDHLDYHPSFEDYAAAKKKLFDELPADGIAIINADDPYASFMVKDTKAEVWPLSFKDGSSSMLHSGTDGMVLDIDGTIIQTDLVGRFNAYNIGLAYLSAVALGISKTNAAAALSTAEGAEGRMQRVSIGSENAPAVLVDYAHTPDALENILLAVRDLAGSDKKVHVIFGCGGDRDKTKRPEMAKIAEKYADFVTVTSDNPRTESAEAIIEDIFSGFEAPERVGKITDRRHAIMEVIEYAPVASIVLIAGKGHETYQEINGVRYDMDDRLIAREALRLRTPNGMEVY